MTQEVECSKASSKIDEAALVESDIEQDEDASVGDRSDATTDDEFYNELMDAPPEFEDHLIPDGCKDETAGIEHLTSCLNRRYHSCPIVFTGALSDALKEAFDAKDVKERRPLLIYVNNDRSVYSNLFCKQLLCHEKVVEFLLMNYVLWAWDVTFPSNGEMLNKIYSETFLKSTDNPQIGTQSIEHYPLLVVVCRTPTGGYFFRRVISGSSKRPVMDEFVSRLIECKDSFDDCEGAYESTKKLTDEKQMHAKSYPMDRFEPFMGHDRYLHHHSASQRRADDGFFSSLTVTLPNAFRQLHINPADSDTEDEDDDDEQTPSVDRPSPRFPK